jgi:hypothetical protein
MVGNHNPLPRLDFKLSVDSICENCIFYHRIYIYNCKWLDLKRLASGGIYFLRSGHTTPIILK